LIALRDNVIHGNLTSILWPGKYGGLSHHFPAPSILGLLVERARQLLN
jgi:hypothetical protein